MAPPAKAGAGQRCQAPENLLRFKAPLPRLASAVSSGKPVRIVALGSSSTQGVGASKPDFAYPRKLQSELRRRYPDRKITVENLGVGGQLASDMLVRIKKDVLPRRPALVIWQTGVNDAMRHVDINDFRETVLKGIDELKEKNIDVVLLDMQYFPRSEKIRGFARYVVAMQEIAAGRKVPILRRFAIMKHMVKTAQFTPQQLLARDLFHPNDVTYGCMGRILADALQGDISGQQFAKYPPADGKPVKSVSASSVR